MFDSDTCGHTCLHTYVLLANEVRGVIYHAIYIERFINGLVFRLVSVYDTH